MHHEILTGIVLDRFTEVQEEVVQNEQTKKKPFHESVVELIDSLTSVGSTTYVQLTGIGRLLATTTIPKNHDAIIRAWESQCARFNHKDGAEVAAMLRAERDALKTEQSGNPPPAVATSSRTNPAFERTDAPFGGRPHWPPSRHNGGSAH